MARAAWIATFAVFLGVLPAWGFAASDPAQMAFSQGLALDLGKGGTPDPAQAFGLYCRAADLGLPDAAFNVAVMADSGRGTRHDEALAARWYAAAAAGGVRRAAYNLGQLYDHGEGVPRNRDVAKAWYRRAAGQGVSAALPHLRGGLPPNDDAPHGTQEDAAVVVFPFEGAAIRQVSRPVALIWMPGRKPNHDSYFVEVAAVQPGAGPRAVRYAAAPRIVFTGETDVTAIDTTAPLPAGQYAWRVFTVHRQTADYAHSAWMEFSVSAP